jgi:hypothetical protein
VRAAALWLAIALSGCAAIRGSDPDARPAHEAGEGGSEEGGAGPPGPAGDVVVARGVCDVDRLRTVRARFRADVAAGERRSVADGVLLVRRPGAVRVKLFGIAGFTVHDAILRGDGARVRGRVSGLGMDAPRELVQTPEARLDEPSARLSLVLWSLWQSRCARPPRALAGTPSTFALDPGPAQVRAREIELASGRVHTEALSWPDGEEVVVHYGEYDPSLAVPLPRRIEIDLPGAGWKAAVRVSEYDLDEPLDEGLFALPEDEGRP